MAKGNNPPPAAMVSIDVKLLRGALKDVLAAVETRNTIPILSNVMLTADGQTISVEGTDLDLWVQRRAPANVTLIDGEPFATTVHASTLSKIVDHLPQDGIALIAITGGKLVLTCGRARFELNTLPVGDFPRAPLGEWAVTFEIPALVLNGAIGRVLHAISTEETRYYLNGIYVHATHAGEGERAPLLRFAATDGHRLALDERELPEGAEALPAMIWPRKAVRVLSGLLDKHEGPVTVQLRDDRLFVEVGEATFFCKAIDGQFPDYTRVIPRSNEVRLAVDRATLMKAVDRVLTLSAEKVRALKVELGKDVLTLSVTSPENGTAVEEIPADCDGGGLAIGFNGRFLLDALGQLTGDIAHAWLGDSAAPTLWRDGEDSASLFVVMPMRV